MTGMGALSERIKRHRFLFEELVKRDFKKKYKRTVLGVLWSVLAHLLNVLVLMLFFVNFLPFLHEKISFFHKGRGFLPFS